MELRNRICFMHSISYFMTFTIIPICKANYDAQLAMKMKEMDMGIDESQARMMEKMAELTKRPRPNIMTKKRATQHILPSSIKKYTWPKKTYSDNNVFLLDTDKVKRRSINQLYDKDSAKYEGDPNWSTDQLSYTDDDEDIPSDLSPNDYEYSSSDSPPYKSSKETTVFMHWHTRPTVTNKPYGKDSAESVGDPNWPTDQLPYTDDDEVIPSDSPRTWYTRSTITNPPYGKDSADYKEDLDPPNTDDNDIPSSELYSSDYEYIPPDLPPCKDKPKCWPVYPTVNYHITTPRYFYPTTSYYVDDSRPLPTCKKLARPTKRYPKTSVERSSRYTTTRPQFSEQSSRYTTTRPQFSEQSSRYTTTRPQFSEQSSRYTTKRPQFSEQSSHYTTKQPQFSERSSHYTTKRTESTGHIPNKKKRDDKTLTFIPTVKRYSPHWLPKQIYLNSGDGDPDPNPKDDAAAGGDEPDPNPKDGAASGGDNPDPNPKDGAASGGDNPDPNPKDDAAAGGDDPDPNPKDGAASGGDNPDPNPKDGAASGGDNPDPNPKDDAAAGGDDPDPNLNKPQTPRLPRVTRCTTSKPLPKLDPSFLPNDDDDDDDDIKYNKIALHESDSEELEDKILLSYINTKKYRTPENKITPKNFVDDEK